MVCRAAREGDLRETRDGREACHVCFPCGLYECEHSDGSFSAGKRSLSRDQMCMCRTI